MSRNRNKTPGSRAAADEAIAELANQPNNTARSFFESSPPIEDPIADLAVRIAQAGGTPSHVAIPLERVELARAAGYDVEFIPTPIKVRELRLRPDVPITANNIVARSKDGVTTEIQFEPWQRHHRVRETDEETGRVRSEYCVPESWCLYVPLAEG